jgi:uncharacterized membrane protein YraQ (UPF0718 family)
MREILFPWTGLSWPRSKHSLPVSSPAAYRTPIVVALVVLALVGLAWWRGGPGLAVAGLVYGGQALLNVAPWLVLAFLLAFLIAGPLQKLIPSETVTRRLGSEAGWQGMALACLAGALFPGGPYAYYPLAGALLQTGAGLGAVVALIAAKNLWSVTCLPLELALLGPRLTFVRIAVTLIIPPVLGLLADCRNTQRPFLRLGYCQLSKSYFPYGW